MARGKEGFFPDTFRANTKLPDEHHEAIRQVDRLRQASKEKLGYGYSIDWQQCKLRKHRPQLVPSKIVLESFTDHLRWLDKLSEFRRLERDVKTIDVQCPTRCEWFDLIPPDRLGSSHPRPSVPEMRRVHSRNLDGRDSIRTSISSYKSAWAKEREGTFWFLQQSSG